MTTNNVMNEIGDIRISTVDATSGARAVGMVISNETSGLETILTPAQAMSLGIALVKAAHLTLPPIKILH